MEWIVFVIAAICLLGAVASAVIAVIGSYRFKYVLNRMHAAAIIDTMAILLSVIGLILLSTITYSSKSEIIFTICKLLLVIVFLWCASPVSSHLISKLEVTTNEQLEDECEVMK